jgi:hypothetical protein
MGWNAGGFGRMSFPNAARAQGWRDSQRAHADWDDWIGELLMADTETFAVAELLAQFAGYHDPSDHKIYLLDQDGADLELVFDVSEDDFRDNAATLAALLRSADGHGATGTFWFLGTAGAEYDFVYELTLGEGRSQVTALAGRPIARIYEGQAYRAFGKQVIGLLEEADPQFRKIMTELREGHPAGQEGRSLHQQVMTALTAFPDDRIAATAVKFPESIPDGQGLADPKKFFAKGARAKLASATSEQLHGVALWTLGELDSQAAEPLAQQALATAQTLTAVKSAAMVALAHRPSAENVQQMLLALDGDDIMARYGALRALRTLHGDYRPQLEPMVSARLQILATADPGPANVPGGPSVVDVVKDHDLRGTTAALAAFAASRQPADARDAAAELLVSWNDQDGLAIVASRLGEEFGIGPTAAKALIILDPDAAFAELTATVSSTEGAHTAADRRLRHLLQALTTDATTARKQSLIHRDPRWIPAVLPLLNLGDNYLTHTALSLLAHSPRNPDLTQRLEVILLAGTIAPIPVAGALQALKSKTYKAAIRKRLTITTDEREIEQLRLCL